MIRRNYLKSLMIFILMCLPLLGASAQQKVTVNVVNASLKQVFSTIENQTSYRFSYKSDIIDHRKDITIRKSGVPVTAVLDAALKGRNLKYSVVSQKSIVVSEKHAAAAPQQSNKRKMQGVVKDDNGEPVIGATVSVVGTDELAVTDMDGRFTINAAKGAKVKVSYLGFVDREVKASENMNIAMSEDTQALSEVVVVGYGTMKRSDMTGALSSVNTKEMAKRTTTNPAEALQGKVAGVNILKSGGNAGAGVSIKIRGIKTTGSNEPLYIVDGFPGDINSVNPQDIESMEILKDGAAAAIYGSVAANGVVLITTKNGKKGETKVDFSSYLSFTQVSKDLDLLDAEGYKKVHKMMYENAGEPLPAYVTHETGVNSDWVDAIRRKGLAQSYMVSLRGGAEKGQYSVSYNHADEKGIFLGNSERHDIARMKVHATKGIIDLDANVDFKFTKGHQPQYQLKEAYMMSPLVPIYDESRKYGFGLSDFDGLPNNRNVVADDHYKKNTYKKYHTTANAALTFNFFPWLNFKTSYGYRGEHEIDNSHYPDYTADYKSPNLYPNSYEYRAYWQEQVFENVLSFNKQIQKHSINAMLGTSLSMIKYNWESVSVEGKTNVNEVINGQLSTSDKPAGFLDPNFPTISGGVGGTYFGTGSYWEYNRASFFGRINYNFNDRYLFQFTFREDGSSKFGADSRWGFFPSVAVGWRISEEPFFPKNSVVSNLKFRASWGKNGNDNIGDFRYTVLTAMGNNVLFGKDAIKFNGSKANATANPDLKWEESEQTDIGFDFGFFGSALTFSADYYVKKTNGMLITMPIPSYVGETKPIGNVGDMKNSGLEFELGYKWNVSDARFHAKANVTYLHNELTNLGNDTGFIDLDTFQGIFGGGTRGSNGQPFPYFYGYKTAGVFQNMAEVQAYVNKDGEMIMPNAKPGDVRFVDVDGDGAISPDDRTNIGNGTPKWTFGFNLNAEWKGFDLNLFLQGVTGNKVFDATYRTDVFSGNFPSWMLDRWTGEGTSNKYPILKNGDATNWQVSDLYICDGSYLRVKNLSLGYTLPKQLTQKLSIGHLRFYVMAENLITWTKYWGFDPEISSGGTSLGVDYGVYPQARTYTIGVNLSF